MIHIGIDGNRGGFGGGNVSLSKGMDCCVWGNMCRCRMSSQLWLKWLCSWINHGISKQVDEGENIFQKYLKFVDYYAEQTRLILVMMMVINPSQQFLGSRHQMHSLVLINHYHINHDDDGTQNHNFFHLTPLHLQNMLQHYLPPCKYSISLIHLRSFHPYYRYLIHQGFQ